MGVLWGIACTNAERSTGLGGQRLLWTGWHLWPSGLLSALQPPWAGLRGWGQPGSVGESSDAGGPGADLHHHVDSRTEGVSDGGLQDVAGAGLHWDEGKHQPSRRKQSPGAPDASSHRTVGSRNVVASASNVPAALHGVQVSHASLTELLFLFSWGKVHFNICSCCISSSSCSQSGQRECLNICCDSGVVGWFGFFGFNRTCSALTSSEQRVFGHFDSLDC